MNPTHHDLHSVFLVASTSNRLVDAIESSYLLSETQIRVATTAQAALQCIRGPEAPCLVVLDSEVPGMDSGQLLAAMLGHAHGRRFAIVLASDGWQEDWKDRLDEGVIDDVIPRELPGIHWRLRLDCALRRFSDMLELQHLRESASRDTDPLTGLANRGALLCMLFRETDRVQRMNSSLTVMQIAVEDMAHWRTRLGGSTCDDLLIQAVGRIQRLLRSYDLFGRIGEADFALGLPGCASVNAFLLAERMRADVFDVPFQAGGTTVRLTANFGIAPSHGRSPLVVLREAEQALAAARNSGRDAIRSRGRSASHPSPSSLQEFEIEA